MIGNRCPANPRLQRTPGTNSGQTLRKAAHAKRCVALTRPPLPFQGVATRSKNGERLHNNSTSGLWSKQKKSAEKKTNKKQQLKLSPTKCSQSKQHPRDSYVLLHLQSECVGNVPNMFLFRINVGLTSNILVFVISTPHQFRIRMATGSQSHAASDQGRSSLLAANPPGERTATNLPNTIGMLT